MCYPTIYPVDRLTEGRRPDKKVTSYSCPCITTASRERKPSSIGLINVHALQFSAIETPASWEKNGCLERNFYAFLRRFGGTALDGRFYVFRRNFGIEAFAFPVIPTECSATMVASVDPLTFYGDPRATYQRHARCGLFRLLDLAGGWRAPESRVEIRIHRLAV